MQLGAGARRSAERYTVENMTQRFGDGIARCLDMVRPR